MDKGFPNDRETGMFTLCLLLTFLLLMTLLVLEGPAGEEVSRLLFWLWR